MKYSYRLITLLALALPVVPLTAQSTRADERAAAAANSRTQMPVVIPAGTPLTVAIDQDLSSASVNAGQRISFHLNPGARDRGEGCSAVLGWKTRNANGPGHIRTSGRWHASPASRHRESLRKESPRSGGRSWGSYARNRGDQKGTLGIDPRWNTVYGLYRHEADNRGSQISDQAFELRRAINASTENPPAPVSKRVKLDTRSRNSSS